MTQGYVLIGSSVFSYSFALLIIVAFQNRLLLFEASFCELFSEPKYPVNVLTLKRVCWSFTLSRMSPHLRGVLHKI